MIRRSFICLAPVALLLAAGAAPVAAADQRLTADGRIPVILHVTNKDPLMWNQALNYVENLQSLYGKDNVDIEIVALGHGIGVLKLDSPLANRVADAVYSRAA